MAKSKVMKGYSVNITEEKFTIPVTLPEVETACGEVFDKSDITEEISDKNKNKNEGEETRETENEIETGIEIEAETGISVRERQEADILAHMEKLEELAEQARETERTSRLIGEEIIAQSQRTADLIIKHTLESAERELENALSRGYSDGFEAGKAEAMKIIEPALGKISLLTEAVAQIQDKMLEDFKDGMFDIISGISKKILQREIDEKDEYLITLFGDAVKDIRAENFVTVTVSEAQAEFAVRNIDLFKAKVANIEDFRIIPDKNADRGTMIVETAKTVADASFSVQVGAIDSILERMKEDFSVMTAAPANADDSYSLDLDNLDYSENPGGEDTANFPGGLNGINAEATV